MRCSRRVRHVVAVFAIGLGACSSSHGDESFPAEVRLNFVAACMGQGATREACSCGFEAIQDEFELDEYVDLEAEMLSTGHLAPEVLAVTQECRNRFRAPTPARARSTTTTRPGQAAIEQLDRFALHVEGTALGADFGGSETVCVTATITNPTDYDVMPMGIFSLALPSGRVEYMAGTSNTVLFPAVASAGSASGTVCFLTHGERGPAELRYNTPVAEMSWSVTMG